MPRTGLAQADKLNKGHPVELAFLAMSHYRQGEWLRGEAGLSQQFGLTRLAEEPTVQWTQARIARFRLREAMLQPHWAKDEHVQAMAREAMELVRLPD